MTPSRPYLLRAFYEWLVDNNLTPHVVVDATVAGVKVPQQYVKHGQIVLNLAPHAVGELLLSNDAVSFNARFGGSPMSVYLPIEAVSGIYARENGAGTVFADDIAPEADVDEGLQSKTDADKDRSDHGSAGNKPVPPGGARPSLRVVK